MELFWFERFRKVWYNGFLKRNRKRFVLKPDVIKLLKRRGNNPIGGLDYITLISITPITLMLDHWEERKTLEEVERLLDTEWDKAVASKVAQSRAPDLEMPEMAPPNDL